MWVAVGNITHLCLQSRPLLQFGDAFGAVAEALLGWLMMDVSCLFRSIRPFPPRLVSPFGSRPHRPDFFSIFFFLSPSLSLLLQKAHVQIMSKEGGMDCTYPFGEEQAGQDGIDPRLGPLRARQRFHQVLLCCLGHRVRH